jgi:hypothetical protein
MVSGLGVKQSADSILSGIVLESSANANNGGLYHNGTGLIIREGAVDTAFFDGGRVGIGTTAPGEKLEVDGNLFLNGDNDKILLGTAKDASIYYDGTNLVINPKEVGSGILDVLGTLQVDGYNSADGTAGATADVATLAPDGTTTRTLHFKNGLFTGSTDS